MKYFFSLIIFFTALTSPAQTDMVLFGETHYQIERGFKQIAGFGLQQNKSTHALIIGFDGLLATNEIGGNFGLGYQYSFLLENGLTFEGNMYMRYGKVITGSSDQGSHRSLCKGKILLEESIGLGYTFNHIFRRSKGFSITPLVRLSFVQGFKDEYELPHSGGTIHCEETINILLPYLGIRYGLKI